MALTIKHLNADASFLLTFEPLLSRPVPGHESKPFHILLDPWVTGPSKIYHSKTSLTAQKEHACVSSLKELPQPDLVIISQHKSNHCNEATLKQIPPTAQTIILAEASAAKVIRAWKHFDRRAVLVMERWEGPRAGGMAVRGALTRIPIPPVMHGGERGEVTVAFIPQRRDLSGLHAAIGITYRPPPMTRQAQSPSSLRKFAHASRTGPPPLPVIPRGLPTPPATPRLHKSYSNLPTVFTEPGFLPPRPPPPQPDDADHRPPPTSPVLSLRSARSASTLTRASTAVTTASSLGHASAQRTLSVIFSPHGILFEGNLATYTTSHLVNEAALPLTALLHCFDRVSSPWWLGGDVLLGAPAGREIAVRLGAMCWVSCHDGEEDARGSATGWLKTRRRWGKYEVERALAGGAEERDPSGGVGEDEAEGRLSRTTTITSSTTTSRCCSKGAGQCGDQAGRETQVIALESGEEVVLTSEGVWNVDRCQQQVVEPGKADDADLAIPPEARDPLESMAEAKARRRKRVTFRPLGESHRYWA